MSGYGEWKRRDLGKALETTDGDRMKSASERLGQALPKQTAAGEVDAGQEPVFWGQE